MVIGVTGNTGSGKSTASRIIRDKIGGKIIDADALGHHLLATNINVQKQLKIEFGLEILDGYNNIDRKRLGSIAFSNAQNLYRLNKIFYPYLTNEINVEIVEAEKIFNYVILDAALIIEMNLKSKLDFLVFVRASKALRLQRIMEKDQLLEEDAIQRIEMQAAEEYKMDAADYIIENENGFDELNQKIIHILKKENII